MSAERRCATLDDIRLSRSSRKELDTLLGRMELCDEKPEEAFIKVLPVQHSRGSAPEFVPERRAFLFVEQPYARERSSVN